MKRFAVLLVAVMASCACVDARTTQYIGVERFAPTDPDKVAVLPREPGQRHERLGEVMLDISIDPPASVADIEDRLREEAAKWGANAIYVARDSVSRSEGRKLIGIAIRYR